MNDDPLVFEEIDIRQAPGFDREHLTVDELVDGINIIHGPNAAGKTTVASGIEWLLWPEACPDRVTVGGRIRRNGDSWEVDVDHGRGRYRQDGADVNGPTRPPASDRDRYTLALHDLLQADSDNDSFADVIQRESAGGYDISAAVKQLGFDDSPTSRRSGVYQEADQAVEDARKAQESVQELREEQETLSTLESKLAEAKEAKRRVALLEDAIEYVEATEEFEEKAAAVGEFPDILEELDGDEADQVAALNERIQSERETINEAETDLESAEETLEEAGFTNQVPRDVLIDECKERTDELEGLETEQRSLEQDIEGAKAKRRKARSKLPLDLETDDLTAIEPDVWSDVAEFARLADEVRAKQQVKTEVDEWLSDQDESTADEAPLERGATALEQWLSTPDSGSGSDDTTAILAGTGAMFLGIAAIVLGVLAEPIYFAGLILAAIAGLVGYRAWSRTDADDPRRPHRESFLQLSLDPPSSWTEEDVRTRLTELYDAMAARSLAAKRDEFRAGLRPNEEELAQRADELEKRCEELRSELGAAPETTDIELTVAVTEISRWQDAHDEVVELTAELETVTEQIESCRTELEATLSEYGYDTVEDAPRAISYIRDLEGRLDTHRDAVDKRKRAEKDIAEAEDEIEDLEAEREAIFTEVGLDPDEFERLEALCAKVTDYEQAWQERRDAELARDRQAERLEQHEGYDESLKSKPIPDLEAELQEAQATAQKYDELHKKKVGIETRIRQAKQASEVETALAEQDRALNALEEQLHDDYASVVGHALTEHIQEDAQFANRPEAFERARDHLITITKGHYDIEFDDDRGSFLALDTVRDRVLRLDELSDGTRLQLLLAVRLAFVEVQESDPQLPLILDETLANSDDERASIIIEAMLDLARDGRQIFYFTAQGDEVARWERALEAADVAYTRVDLADKLGLESTIEIPELESIHIGANDLPDPDAHDHESYGEALDVPRFNPRDGASSIHVWYLVDDVAVLHRLLDAGIERWGQLKTVIDRPNATLLGEDRDVIQSFRLGGIAIEAFVEAWQQGRGDPVDQAALEDSGAVTDTFIEEVTELARTHNGDATKIIRGLRNSAVKGFRSGKMDELEEYFEAEGYIPAADPLEPEEIQRRVLQRLLAQDVDRERAMQLARDVLSRVQNPPASTTGSPAAP